MKKRTALLLAVLMLVMSLCAAPAWASTKFAAPAADDLSDGLPFEEDASDEGLIVPPVPTRATKHSVSKFMKWALKHIDPASIPTNANLYVDASSCGTSPWEYLYGTVRTATTDSNILSRYNNYYTTYMPKTQYDEITADWSRSTYATDCQGLLDAWMTYEESVTTDINVQTNYSSWCTSKGEIDSITRDWVIGEAVFVWSEKLQKFGHIGWICGFDESGIPLVVEARGVSFGVVITRLTDRAWTHRGLMTVMFNYDASMKNNGLACGIVREDEEPVRSSSVTPKEVWNGTVASGFAGGTGTEADPYVINTAAQLAYLSSAVQNGTTYNGKFIVLNNDLWLNDTTGWTSWDFFNRPANEWTPIGTYTNNSTYLPFRGSFDGRGHTIYGMFFSENKKSCYGLFGYVGANTSGCIKNVTIDDSFMEAVNNVGAIVGFMKNYGGVENCINKGKVRGSLWAGGIVGYITNTSGTTRITGCRNTTSVRASADTGGIVGYAHENCVISGCSNNASYVKSYERGGGIVGHANSSTIENCYSIGEIRGTDMLGGVIGMASGSTIRECFNGFDFTARYRSGGVAGYVSGSSLEDCFNTGSVTCIEKVGGIVGVAASSPVSKVYNIGVITAKRNRGGVIGTATSPQVSAAYKLEGCCVGSTSYGEYLELSAFADAASYQGFDFGSVWTIDPASAYPFAELRSLPYVPGNMPDYTPEPTATPTAAPTPTPEPTEAPTPDPTVEPTPTPEPTENAPTGDVNGDGTVDSADALLVLRASLGLSELTEEQAAEADLNGDGVIDSADALIVLRMSMGLE